METRGTHDTPNPSAIESGVSLTLYQVTQGKTSFAHHPGIHSFTDSFTLQFIHSLVPSFIHSSLTHSLTLSTIHLS